MDTRQLEYIIAISEERSISKAAERLFLTQPALSQQLHKLESEGIPPLFRREKGEMVLTDSGKIYVNGARSIIKIYQAALEQISALDQQDRKTLSIGVSDCLREYYFSIFLPRFIAVFQQFQLSPHFLEDSDPNEQLPLGHDLNLYPHVQKYRNEIPGQRDSLVWIALNDQLQSRGSVFMPKRTSFLGQLAQKASINNRIFAESNDFNSAIKLAQQGICSAIVPQSLLQPEQNFPVMITIADYNISCFAEDAKIDLRRLFI